MFGFKFSAVTTLKVYKYILLIIIVTVYTTMRKSCRITKNQPLNNFEEKLIMRLSLICLSAVF